MEQQTETEVDDSTTSPSANDDTAAAAAAAPVDVVTEDASTLGRYQIRQLNHR